MPELLDLASRQIDGAYFLRRRSSDPADFIPGSADGPYRHCFTYWKSERTIRRELEAMIAAANHKIFIASFLLGDAALLDALYAAADRLLGGVYVITQLNEHRLRKGLDELGENSSDTAVQAQKKRFDEMTRRGIYVRGHPDCHAKFVVVDDEKALVTSANLMTDALDKTGENGVVITDGDQVQRLARLFARLWHTGCEWEANPGEAYKLHNCVPDTSWANKVPPPRMGSSPEVIWTDGTECHILATIQDLITHTENDLVLASFNLKGLRNHREMMLNPIRDAVEQGVRVRLLIRPRRNQADHLADAIALAEAGVEVYADPLTHAKVVIADGRRGALFSANFDFEHGLTSGVEVGCRLDGSPALAEATRYLHHALDQAPLSYTVRPTHQDLAERLDAAWRVPWPLDAQFKVLASRGERTRFVHAASNGPVLFIVDSPERLTLCAGNRRWHLTLGHPDGHRLTPANPDGFEARRTLTHWLSTTQTHPPRGICPAVIEWVDQTSVTQ